jgi:hypothetical protein
MKVDNVIRLPQRPKPARLVPIVGYVGEGGRVVFTQPRPAR